MTKILILAGLVVAWFALRPVLRLALAGLFADTVAKKALARQPDAIHLERASASPWKDAGRAERWTSGFRAAGFADAGTWTVPELPGVVLALLVHPAEMATAAVYEHPQAGGWCEVFFHAQDGTGATFTSARPTGLTDRPGHPTTHLTGAEPAALVAHALSHRPSGWLVTVSADAAARHFAEAYAEAIAWRKSHGVSRTEVMNVARRRAA